MKKNIGVLFLVLLFCMLSACQEAEKTEPTKESQTPVAEENTIEIYTVDVEDAVVAPIKVKTTKKEPELKEVVKLVSENLEEEVKVTSAKLDGDTAIICFSEKTAPLHGCSAGVESMILDCYANSILDNVSACNYVVFRGEDGAYKGGHIELDQDEVYASK